MNSIIIDNNSNIRIDKILKDELGLSRTKVQDLITNNLVLVNDKVVKNNYITKENDVISFLEKNQDDNNINPENIKLDIIYEDEDVIVVNKPSSMVVHPSLGHTSGTLVNALLYYKSNLSKINGSSRPGIIHRIDKDTSGILLVAKNDKAHEVLSNDIKNKTVKRTYIALVSGVISHNTGTIDAPIGRDKKDRKRLTVTNENSKDAITHFKVLERLKNATLVECYLETGRTHQIRVHFKYIGHPIINDPIYSKERYEGFGQMLHSKQIEFEQPTTKEKLEFICKEPQEFIDIVNMYR